MNFFTSVSALKVIWKPFDEQFGDVLKRFRYHEGNVVSLVSLGHMIAAADERALQRDWREGKEHQENIFLGPG